MRTAKAEYIRALKDLRAADAEYVRAKAAVEQANARYVDAQTAYQNAVTENQNLLNELQALYNEAQEMENELRAAEIEAEIAALEMEIEKAAAEHAIEMVNLSAELAKANEALRVVLRDIAISSKSLSPNEKLAVAEASALVAVLTKAQYDVIVDLAQAEAELDTLVLNAINANFIWDEGLLEGKEKHYQHQIEAAQANIAQYKALREAIPDTLATLEEWKAVLDNYDKAIEVIEEQMAKNTYDSSAYVKVIVGSGIQSFNEAIAEFIEENWDENGNVYTEPVAPTKAQRDSAAKAEPKQEDYKITTTADSITGIKPLTGVKSRVNFNKYVYLLKSYTTQVNPLSSVEAKFMETKIHTEETNALKDSLVIVGPVNQKVAGFKDFIFGTLEHNSDQSLEVTLKGEKITADYGLKGALAVLMRVEEENQVRDTAKARVAYQTAKSNWETANATLKAGLGEYAAFKSAIEEYKNAVSEDGRKNAALMEAFEDFIEELDKIRDDNTDLSFADSVALMQAIVKFADARDKYVVDTNNNFTDPSKNKYPRFRNPHYFYFPTSVGIDTGDEMRGVVVDSIKFSDLNANVDMQKYFKYAVDMTISTRSMTEFTNDESIDGDYIYDFYTHDPVYVWYEAVQARPGSHYGSARYRVIANILKQMFPSEWFGRGIWEGTRSNSMGMVVPQEDNLVWTPGIFFGQYVAGRDEDDVMHIYPFDDAAYEAGYDEDWNDIEEYIAEAEVEEYEEPAVAEAAKKVFAALVAYNKIYNAYWNEEAPATVATLTEDTKAAALAYALETAKPADKLKALVATIVEFNTAKLVKEENAALKATAYTAADFADFADGEPFVLFSDEVNVDATPAVCAILASKDPYSLSAGDDAAWTEDGAIAAGAIFNQNKTLFYTYMLAKYKYYLATDDKLAEDIETIKAWIREVEAAYKADADVVGTPDVAKYTKDHNAWKHSKDVVEKYAPYYEAKVAFVGTRVVGKDTLPNDLYLAEANMTSVTKPLKDENFKIRHATNNITDLFATNILGDYVGWAKELGGQQLANAKKAFGEKPYEQIQDWKDEWRAANRLKNGLYEAKVKAEAVYVAKAKVEGIDGDAETIDAMIAARDAYKTELTNKIKKEQEDIDDACEKLNALADDNINWEKVIAQKTAEVEAIKSQLNAINKALESAKANLDKIMDYIRSTDAEFVIPVTLEDVDIVIATIEKALAVVGLFPDPEDPAVDPEGMSLADAIAALLAQYGVSVNIDFQPAQD